MPRRIITCKECGKEKPQIAHGLCCACYHRQYQRPPGLLIITQAQVEQIDRLLGEYFGDGHKAYKWLVTFFKPGELDCNIIGELDKNYDVIRRLATAKRAGEVIRVLKQMHARRKTKNEE